MYHIIDPCVFNTIVINCIKVLEIGDTVFWLRHGLPAHHNQCVSKPYIIIIIIIIIIISKMRTFLYITDNEDQHTIQHTTNEDET